MSTVADSLDVRKIATFAAAVVIGLSIGTMASGSEYALPALGTVPGLFVGGVGLLAGGGLYVGVKRYWTSGCGCSGDCNC